LAARLAYLCLTFSIRHVVAGRCCGCWLGASEIMAALRHRYLAAETELFTFLTLVDFIKTFLDAYVEPPSTKFDIIVLE
jgi:hypothetical protein